MTVPALKYHKVTGHMKYLFHAFKNPWNLLYLFFGFFAAVGTLFSGLGTIGFGVYFGLEALYLTAASTNKRFQKIVRARIASAEDAYLYQRQRNAVRGSKAAYRERLRKFEKKVRDILKNYRSLSNQASTSDDSFLEKSLKRVDDLQKEFTRFLYNHMKIEEMLKRNNPREDIYENIKKLKEELKQAKPEMKDIYSQRLEILEKRAENARISDDNREYLEAQLETLEETIDYLLETSYSLNKMRSIEDRVDETVIRMNTAKETLLDIEAFSELSDTSIDLNSFRERS